MGAGCPKVQASSLRKWPEQWCAGRKTSVRNRSVGPCLLCPPFQGFGAFLVRGSLGVSTSSCCFGGIVLITFDVRHCPHIASHPLLALFHQILGPEKMPSSPSPSLRTQGLAAPFRGTLFPGSTCFLPHFTRCPLSGGDCPHYP